MWVGSVPAQSSFLGGFRAAFSPLLFILVPRSCSSAVIMMSPITDGISDSDCTLLTIKHPIEKWKCWVINIV